MSGQNLLQKLPLFQRLLGKGKNSLILQSVGRGETLRHRYGFCRTERLRWVDAEHPEVFRNPEPKTRVFDDEGRFEAAGKRYPALVFLLFDSPKGAPWYRDRYGREVLYLKERFPCFDDADYLYENRYFRYFYIYTKNRLTFVRSTDGDSSITVTEDVQDIPFSHWETFQEEGFHTR